MKTILTTVTVAILFACSTTNSDVGHEPEPLCENPFTESERDSITEELSTISDGDLEISRGYRSTVLQGGVSTYCRIIRVKGEAPTLDMFCLVNGDEYMRPKSFILDNNGQKRLFGKERQPTVTQDVTASGMHIEEIYTPVNVEDFDYLSSISIGDTVRVDVLGEGHNATTFLHGERIEGIAALLRAYNALGGCRENLPE